jgi:hypothetical protein
MVVSRVWRIMLFIGSFHRVFKQRGFENCAGELENYALLRKSQESPPDLKKIAQSGMDGRGK